MKKNNGCKQNDEHITFYLLYVLILPFKKLYRLLYVNLNEFYEKMKLLFDNHILKILNIKNFRFPVQKGSKQSSHWTALRREAEGELREFPAVAACI